MIAARVGQTSEFTLASDLKLDPTDRTIFEIRCLSAAARAKVQDAMVGFDEKNDAVLQCPGTGMLIACKFGVAGWKNMKDEEGNDVYCKSARTPDGPVLLKPSLDAIANEYMEVGGAIIKLNKMDEDEETEGKLGNAPDSPSSQTSPQSEPSIAAPTKSPTSSNAPNAEEQSQTQETPPAVAAAGA